MPRRHDGSRNEALSEALLPSGASPIEDVAERLAVSKRTLQRRLQNEDTNYQVVLGAVRERLAKHYLTRTTISGAEIAFLLGFNDPNSFYRAFHGWAGIQVVDVRDVAAAHVAAMDRDETIGERYISWPTNASRCARSPSCCARNFRTTTRSSRSATCPISW